MYFMKTGEPREIPSGKADIYIAYQVEFIPFVKRLNAHQRKVDKALYSFGQFFEAGKSLPLNIVACRWKSRALQHSPYAFGVVGDDGIL